jgi:hypothetical protein
MQEINLDYITEDFEAILEALGFYDITTYYCGFGSQGDGASFEAKFRWQKGVVQRIKEFVPREDELHEIAHEIVNVAKRANWDLELEVYRAYFLRYFHEETMEVEIDDYFEEMDENKKEELEEQFLENVVKPLARWYYDALEAEYYLQLALEDDEEI